MNVKPDVPDYQHLANRVAKAVESDNKRKRFARWVFLVLLIIPVTAGLMIMKKGQTDSEWVQKNARVAVQPELQEVRKSAEGIKQVLPEVQGAVAEIEATSTRIDALERNQAQQNQTVEANFARLENQQRATMRRVEEIQVPITTTNTARDPRVDALMERLQVMENQLKDTRRELSVLKERGAAVEPAALAERLNVIERRLQINR